MPYLDGVRVLEIGDEQGDYCGRVLAGMGADVVKVEPPGGEVTRTYGPFVDDEPHPDRSLYFWHYNLGKRSVVLDLDTESGRSQLADLVAVADVVVDSRPSGFLESRGLGYESLRQRNDRLVYVKITPFGEDGPWAGYQAGDLVHLALGGVVMNCGYDPDPRMRYRTPPVAPQMWHAYHITGEMAVMSVLAALNYRHDTGIGQRVDLAVHDAVSKNSETDIPDWIARAQDHYRRTCSHSVTAEGGGFSAVSSLSRTQDGRWLLPYRAYGWMKGFVDGWPGTLALVRKYGMQADLDDAVYESLEHRSKPAVAMHITDVVDQVVERLPFAEDLWREGQASGMPWAPIRKPEENVADEHWTIRGTYAEVHHSELGATYKYLAARWVDRTSGWRVGPRPPLVGEHTEEVLESWPVQWFAATNGQHRRPADPPKRGVPVGGSSKRGKPFALSGVRVLDLSWMLASAGAGRFLAAHGAEVVKVEHETRWDGMRFGLGVVPNGGKPERDAATAPIPLPQVTDPNRAFGFMEINAGKLGISLNLKDDRGKELLTELIGQSDVLLEGFSPGTLERMGFGYERLREINPGIIYVQQSGMGHAGLYGRMRSYGPTAQAFTGLTDMSGLPEPYPPAGIGYSYLDWFGAYNMANAVFAALYRRKVTGEGCWIDCSQAETGLYLTGTAVLDHEVNGRTWQRYGNRSPYKPAAPHGVFPTTGEDRWIAIACFTDDQWSALAGVLDLPESRFATEAGRLAEQDALEALVGQATREWDGYALMAALQSAGVPAGVCQSARDRCERDPQLAHLHWLVDLEQTDLGIWPMRELPGRLSETPSYLGGRYDRAGPSYGEDTEEFYQRALPLSDEEVAKLRVDGVL